MAVKKGTSHGVHIFLTVITFGLWLGWWVLAGIFALGKGWTCSKCGLKV